MLIESWVLSHYKDRFSDIRTPIIKGWRSSDRVNFIMIIRSLVKSYLYCLIEAEWRIYASVNWAIIGSDNGMSPGRRQAIIWTNAGILPIRTLWTNFSDIFFEFIYFHSRDAFENIVWKMVAILSRLQCVDIAVRQGICDGDQNLSI